jgi:hypothetical protein
MQNELLEQLQKENKALKSRVNLLEQEVGWAESGYNQNKPANTLIQRFTVYRRNISQRDTHNPLQKNADAEPQFEGVVWTDGTVAVRWLTACRSTSVWGSVQDMLDIHGHPEYGTEIKWHDGPARQEWLDKLDAYKEVR